MTGKQPTRKPKRETASKSLSVGFISLGCAKNLVDSQLMAGNLLAEGIALAASPEEADVVIVNTCAFIEDAREESIDGILSACEMKRRGSCRKVIVTGCLPQRYREDLQHSLPEVDAFLGLDELDRIGTIVARLSRGAQDILDVSTTATRLFEPKRPDVVFTGGPFAYLKIAEGCNHRCSFCAIPGIRGRHRSRPVAGIVKEAEHLLEQGYRELDLISQDVTSYGRDLPGKPALAELLRELGKIGGRFWIRLLYGFPSRVTTALLDSMGEVEQACHYLDLPVQHSHPDILRAMQRGGTLRAVEKLGERIRSRLPDAVLRTTCLVGFPGERKAHFEHLLRYVRSIEFDHLGVFVFSPEEHTAAVSLPGRVARAVAERRRSRLLLTQKEIVDRKLAALMGREDVVLLERPVEVKGSKEHGRGGKERAWIGRSRRQAPEIDGETVVTGTAQSARAGDFLRVRYTAGADYDMTAVALPG